MVESQRREAFVDRVIRAAIECGEFDELSGKGKPIPGAGTVGTAGWWIRRWIERNRRHVPSPPMENDLRA